jgi:predicted alpha/beta hydrolase family esterase
MKNVLILHGTGADHTSNWFPWLKNELEKRGYKVWVPDLPNSIQPNIKKYNDFIFSNKNWEFNNNSVIVGHSSGAVAGLGILQKLPKDVKIGKCILAGSFKGTLGWKNLSNLWSIDIKYNQIRNKANEFIFLHSDDDPYCPLEHAKDLSEKTNGKLFVIKGAKHFSFDPAYEISDSESNMLTTLLDQLK